MFSVRILGHNSLNGTIPETLANLRSLKDLDISYCNFTGQIPSQLGNLPSIRSVYLDFNGLTGSPPDFSINSPLSIFSASHNQLDGSLPNSFGLLQNLDTLYLQNNRMVGTVSNFVCILANMNLQHNQWSCPVPACCSDTGNFLCLPCFWVLCDKI